MHSQPDRDGRLGLKFVCGGRRSRTAVLSGMIGVYKTPTSDRLVALHC
jgi:hypothetical protein